MSTDTTLTEPTLKSKAKFKPRDYQEPILESIIAHCKKPNAKPAFVEVSVGGGKCLAKDTPILMFDGTVKPVQEVVTGDLLMSHDSKPRTVESTTTGREMMYRVDQNRGDSYEVNESHILSFKLTNQGGKRITVNNKKYIGGDIVNISVTDYLALPKWKQRELKGWKPSAGVDFPKNDTVLTIPPYILGVWLGDGHSSKPEICSVDNEVIEQWSTYAESIGLKSVIRSQEGKVNNYYITHGIKCKPNSLTDKLRGYNLIKNKHIPRCYLVAPRSDRLEMLAGILDTDGYLTKGKNYDLVLKQKSFAKGVEFLVRSLGMWCTARECRKVCTNTGAVGTYYRMSIGGDTRAIPCRVERRKVTRFNSHGIGKTGVIVTKLEVGDYYGFEISGNDKLFLLGDFTVTHNTALYAFISDHVASRKGKALILARQGELVDQNSQFAWKAGVNNSVFSASLNKKSIHYPVVYGTEGTVANAIGENQKMGYTINKSTGAVTYNFVPSILLIDECHMVDFNNPDSQYMKIINYFLKVNPKLRIIGGTGSPIRGKEYIVGDFWDERLYELSTAKLVEWGWLVPPVFGFPEPKHGYDFSSIEVDKDGTSFDEKALDKIVLENPTLTHNIIHEIMDKTVNRLGVLIFLSTKKHCKEAAEALPVGSYGIITDSTGYKERAKILKASRSGEIKYLLNVGVLATGYNNPRIDTVCYLRPLDSLTLLIQTLGRGFRIPEEEDNFTKKDCLVLDYADVFARLGDLYENPILEQATSEKSRKNGETIICPKCEHENGIHARRCNNVDPLSNERCDYFWQSRQCPVCETENDICARECRHCKEQLIDPNAKLTNKHYTATDYLNVLNVDIKPCRNNGMYIIYTLDNGEVAKEFFSPLSPNMIAKRIFKEKFIKVHLPKNYWREFQALRDIGSICSFKGIMKPKQITHRIGDKGNSIIHKKLF